MIEISLAKFKKKQSKPTEGKKDQLSDNNDKTVDGPKPSDSSSLPPPQKTPTTEDSSKDDPPINLFQQGEKESKLNKLFWLRVIIAVIAGVSATFIFDSVEGEERRWSSIIFMIVVFFATIIVGKTMRIPFALSDRKKIVTQGIGSYIFIYLFMWVISYTLVNLEDTATSNGMMPFP